MTGRDRDAAKLVVNVPIPPGDTVADGARIAWRGAVVTRNWQDRIGQVLAAQLGADGRGIEVTIALDPEHADLGRLPRQQQSIDDCWVFVHPNRPVAPFAGIVSPRQRGMPCARPDCHKPADGVTRVRIDLPVYSPAAYELHCRDHRPKTAPQRPPAADGEITTPDRS